MDFKQLVEIQKSGALKVNVDSVSGTISMGGMQVTPQQLQILAQRLGWTRWDENTVNIIEKTDKFIRNMVKNLKHDEVILGTQLTFENHRASNSLKYYERIKLVNPEFDYTVLCGMPGTGGAYAIYDATNLTHLPVYTCRSIKQVAEFFNDLYED